MRSCETVTRNDMKTRLITLMWCFCISTVFSQNNLIIPIKERPLFDVPNGGYLKDVDYDFSPYLGNWTFQDSLYNYAFSVYAKQHVLVQYPNEDYHWEDQILATYEVSNVKTDSIIFDSKKNDEYYSVYEGSLYKNKEGILFISVYDAAGGNLTVEFEKVKGSRDGLYFRISKEQISVCGTPEFNRKKCPLPRSNSKFRKGK